MVEPSRLITSRLVLEPLCDRDFEDVLSLWRDEEYQRYLGAPTDRDGALRSFQCLLRCTSVQSYGPFVIRRAKGQQFAGTSGLQKAFVDDGSSVEATCALIPRARQQGVAVEALHAVLEDGFSRCQLERILGVVRRDNKRSRALVERLGFSYWKPRYRPAPAEDSGPEDIYVVTPSSLKNGQLFG